MDRSAARGRVAGLFTAPRQGVPVEAREAVELVPGLGIPGDRYATRQGYWSDPRWPDQELTLAEREVADATGLAPGDLRRNVITEGLRLEDLIGRRFQMGEAVVEGVRPCDPCQHLEALTRPGVLRALTGRGGLRARIVQRGSVRVGDEISVLPDEVPGA